VELKVVIGLVLALACAAGASVSGLWKQKGVVEVDDVDIRHPVHTAVALFRSKWFAIGWLAAAVAWLLHVGALALAPLSLAQAVISGGLVLLGIIAERFFGFKLSRRQWLGLVLLAAGMAVLAATTHSTRNQTSFTILGIIAFELIGVGLGAAAMLSCRLQRLRERHGVMLGLAAGFWFGVADVTIKAVTGGSHGLIGVLGPWTVMGLLAALAAFYASARSLQIGEAVAVIASTAAAANVLGIAGGVIVFRDPLGSDPATVIGRIAAFVLVVLAATLMPAPVRAQEVVRNEAEEQQEQEQKQEEERCQPRPQGQLQQA
jgi:multidrug transporter EmrE-like cation transporter